MRVGESFERGFDSPEKWQSTGCMGIHTLDPLWQVSLEEEEEVNGAIVRLNALVRGCYVSHLGRVLAKNCELCSSGSGYVFTSHDIEKFTAQLEMLALRACMVSSLYQKAMTQMTTDIKRNTEELKLYEKLKEFVQQECTCSRKENKETQTDSINETLPDVSNIKTEPDIENDVEAPIQAPNPVVFPETPNPEPVNNESQAMPIPVYVSGMTVTPNNLNVIPTVDTQDHENFFNSDTSHLWFGSSTSHLFGSKKVGDKAANSPKNGLCSLKNSTETSEVLFKQQEKLNNSVSVPQKISKCVRILRSDDIARNAVEKLSDTGSRRVDSSCGRVVKRLRLNGENNKVNTITSDAKIIRHFASVGGKVPETTEEERSILGIRRLESSEKVICEDGIGKESDARKGLKLPVPCENESSESNDSGTQHLLRILESEGEECGDSDVTADVQNVLHSSRSDQRSKSIEHRSRKSLPSGFDLGSGTVPDNSEPNIWTMQKFIQQRLLHDKIARTCCYPEKKLEVLSRFNELFGFDSDEDEVWCSEHQITKYRRRIASWVVERLLPYYREKRLLSRVIFKAVAREITNKLISINHLPSEDDVEKGVLLFFSYHGIIASESDIWDGWGKTLK
ncbi:uncharacterized protein [Anabrus simplex]|uniref:uncharacterized protein n=1 Tax=Anabrus simplex TaxID=316456 RepID=UPI0035A3B769